MPSSIRSVRAWRAPGAALGAAALLLSCQLSSGFLSDSERSSLYDVSICASDGSSLANGAIVAPGTSLSVLVSKKSGASAVATLDFSLSGVSGAVASATHLLIAGASASSSDPTLPQALTIARSVSAIDGRLDGFTVPDGLAPGLYAASASVASADGSASQKAGITLFVGQVRPSIASVSAFPPSIEPGASVLLGMSLAWQPTAASASGTGDYSQAIAAASAGLWVRWSKDGVSFAEGPVSSGLDKVVWQAPQAEGAYSLLLEVFPAAPALGSASGADFAFKSPISEDLKIMVIRSQGESGDDFADPLAFYSMLRLKGSFDDLGTRPRAEQPSPFGSPSIDTYSQGFGYRLGPTAGVRIPGLMPPAATEGGTGAFSTLIRLDSTQTDGIIERFASKDGGYVLVVGLAALRPYAEFLVNGVAERSTALAPVSRFPLTLEAVFVPDGSQLDVSWEAEGERLSSPPIPLPPAPPEGSAQLGGPDSLAGVYDGFGLMVGAASPAYRLASRRAWKSDLVLAEGFEEGAAPAGSTTAGQARFALGSLELFPGSSLSLSPVLSLSSDLLVEADMSGDCQDCSLAFSVPGGARVLSVGVSGTVEGQDGRALGTLPPGKGRLAFALRFKGGVLSVLDAAGAPRASIPSSAKRLALSLERTSGLHAESAQEADSAPSPARVESVLVRSIVLPQPRK